MPFGRKARHIKAFQFGARAPLEGMEAVLAQHRLRGDYYNALIEMELRGREERVSPRWPRSNTRLKGFWLRLQGSRT